MVETRAMSEARADDPDDDLTDFAAGPRTDVLIPVPVAKESAVNTRRPRTMLATVGVFALLALACVIAAALAWRDVAVSGAVMNARQSRLSGSLVLEGLLDAETSQRGYLLTRDPAYLANYDNAKGKLARSLAELKDRTPGTEVSRDSDNPECRPHRGRKIRGNGPNDLARLRLDSSMIAHRDVRRKGQRQGVHG